MKTLLSTLFAFGTSCLLHSQEESVTIGYHSKLTTADIQAALQIAPFNIQLPNSVANGDLVTLTLKGFKKNSKSEVTEIKSYDFGYVVHGQPDKPSNSCRILITPENITLIGGSGSTRLKTSDFIPGGYCFTSYSNNELEDGSFCLVSFPDDVYADKRSIEHQDRWITASVSIQKANVSKSPL